MRTNHLWRITSIIMLLAMLISPLGATGSVSAARAVESKPVTSGPQVISASFVGVSQPLSSIKPMRPDPGQPTPAKTAPENRPLPKAQNNPSDSGFDAGSVQVVLAPPVIPTPIANFEGVNNIDGVLPPDTNGDVGSDPATGIKYYMQWVNVSYQIWNVTNPAAPTSLAGPFAGNSLWTGTGTICEANNDGDPIVLFDHLSNRWMVSQFALGFPNNFHQCIAVSTSADPTGTWYLYDFKTSSTLMNDYPHFGVWSDGYYMTVNQFDGVTSGWEGAGVAVFERDAMLAGLPARMIYMDLGAVTLNYGGMLPSDLDGPAPAVGTPNYFMEWDDSTWLGDANDTLRIWEFKTDWATPSNTTFGLNTSYDPNIMITTANVDPNLCGGAACITQPGTTVKLDTLADRLMHRLQFRNFGSYQTLVGNHTVDATSTDKAGIHWFELRNTGSGWVINQESVFAPDGDQRWMASAAMDYSGDIAMGYSVSSSSTYPSIRYTGRLAADPLNSMTMGEGNIIAGSGSQTSPYNRWGDYSMLSVDPSDECTYWFTTEYMATTSDRGWQTRIGSFKFPSCTSLPTGTLQGTVTSSAGGGVVAGATVSVTGGYSTLTDGSGVYHLTLPAGTYDVTASKYSFTSSTVNGAVVTVGSPTTQDLVITPATVYHLSGTIKDATTNWPLYSKIEIAGYPYGAIYNNPITGAYGVDLAAGPYTLTVGSMISGYTGAVQPVTISADTSQNFALNADTVACNAPGYQTTPGVGISSENFDSATAPALPTGWAKLDTNLTSGDWVTRTVALHPAGIAPHSAANMAVFNSYTASSNAATRLYQTTGLDLSAQSSAEVSFWMYHDTAWSANDTIQVQVSTNSGSTWSDAGAPVSRYDGSDLWKKHTVNLNPYAGAGMTDVRLAFLGTSQFGSDMHLDDVAISTASQCNPIASTGLVIGIVKDANNSNEILNFSVEDASAKPAAIIDASADAGRLANKIYVISQLSGTQSITANAPGFGPLTHNPVVVAGGAVRQDFAMPSASLSATPNSLTFSVPLYAPTDSKTVTINNTGTYQGNIDVFAVLGAAPSAPIPTGPFASNTRHVGPKNLNDPSAKKLRVDLIPRNVAPIDAGEVLDTWNPGLPAPWGIGYNTAATDLWIGNFGHNFDYRFLPSGFSTGDKIDLTSWVSGFGADMTYNPFTKSLWQVNVGGDTCIYELNPSTKLSTGNKICPAFGTSERGLAFDPVSNTYYAGSWTDGIINHFAPDGTILDSKATGLSISGLAFNPSTGHLFAMTNALTTSDPTIFDVYSLDTANNYTILGGFNIRNGTTNAFTDNAQAGLEMDCNGDLWAVDQTAGLVYKASSGESGACDWQLASWVTASPAQGAIPQGGNLVLNVNVDATGLKFLTTYQAHLRITNDSPYGNVVVPVTLNVGQTFADVPADYWANSFVQRLYYDGITSGCSNAPLSYCPESNVTRAQMAVFLLRSEHGRDYLPSAPTGTVFADVAAGSFAAAWIEQLKAEGITSGCTATNYCPDAPVTRAQMAVFLLKAEHIATPGYTPPAETGLIFTDVPAGSFAAAWIEQLKAEGVTSGCTATTYCPGNSVTRAEMAVFLIRTFSLP